MKKIMIVFAALALLLTACAHKEVEKPDKKDISIGAESFVEGKHQRREDYMASFRTMSVALDGLEIIFAADVYDEALSPAIAEEIAETYYSISSYAPDRAAQLKIYVVSLTSTGGPVLIKDRLYVSDSAVESGEYKPWLVSCVYDIRDWWRCVGLSLLSSGYEPYEIHELEYAKGSNLLSLHPCYFLDAFADETTQTLAKHTALALTQYIVSEKGFYTFLDSGNNISFRAEWLESIGLQYDLSIFEAPAALRLENMSFSYTDDIPMILSEKDFKLNIHNVDWLGDSEGAYAVLLDFSDGVEKLYKHLENEAPTFYAHLIDNSDITAVQFRNSDYPTSSRASMLKSEAIVTDDADLLHEIVHTFMPRASIEEAYWLCEGLACYLTAPYISYNADRIVVNSVMSDYDGDTEEDKFFRSETLRIFKSLNGCDISSVYTMDQPIYKVYEASAYAAFLNPDINSIPAATKSIKTSYNERLGNSMITNYPGNELSYLESMLFVEWLVEKYGLDTIIWAEMSAENYFELFPDAKAFEKEFGVFRKARVEPLNS